MLIYWLGLEKNKLWAKLDLIKTCQTLYGEGNTMEQNVSSAHYTETLHLQLSLDRYLHVSLMKIVCIMLHLSFSEILKLTQFCTNIPIFKYKFSYNWKRKAKFAGGLYIYIYIFFFFFYEIFQSKMRCVQMCSSPELLDPLLSVCTIHEPGDIIQVLPLWLSCWAHVQHSCTILCECVHLFIRSSSPVISIRFRWQAMLRLVLMFRNRVRIKGEAHIRQGPSEKTLSLL